MAVTVTPLANACAAEIGGVGLRLPLAPDEDSAIYRASPAHRIIVFGDRRRSNEGGTNSTRV